MNVEMARNDLPELMILFARNKLKKLFLVRFRYCHCYISIIMPPSGYFIGAMFGPRSIMNSALRVFCKSSFGHQRNLSLRPLL